jgi:ribosomal protein L11 methyltransferase
VATYPALDIRFDPGPGAGALQDQLYAELDDFEPLAIHEHDAGDGWRVFFKSPELRAGAQHLLTTAFGNHVLDVEAVDVDDEDWARKSQADLKAIHVGRITVAPPWDLPSPEPRIASPASAEPRAPSPDIAIVIEPSMGFGTGHHATTRLCLGFLQEIDLRGRRVIDVGTGSGVLAIAARMLGAETVVALDNDPDALQNARENAARNGVEIQIVEIDLGSFRLRHDVTGPPADLVVANLTGAVLRRFADVLRSLVAPGGSLIVSGFSPSECNEVVAALAPGAEAIRTDGDWAAALIRRG